MQLYAMMMDNNYKIVLHNKICSNRSTKKKELAKYNFISVRTYITRTNAATNFHDFVTLKI